MIQLTMCALVITIFSFEFCPECKQTITANVDMVPHVRSWPLILRVVRFRTRSVY
jgi:hypothetical protein